MARSRESCAIQLDTFADMMQRTAKELEDSIFTDERLERKIAAALKKKDVRVLYTHFFMNGDGRYEIHVTARSMKKEKIPLKEIARTVSDAAGRRLILSGDSAQMLGTRYMDRCMQRGTGVFHSAGNCPYRKGCADISGDNFSMMDMSGGRRGGSPLGRDGVREDACRRARWS